MTDKSEEMRVPENAGSSKPPQPIDARQILRFIARVPFGMRLVDELLPQLRSGEAVILALDAQAAGKIRPHAAGSAQSSFGIPAGGFVYEGFIRQIFVEDSREIRLQAPLLVHEIAHCLDASYIGSYAEEKQLFEEFRATALSLMTAAAERLGRTAEEITLGDLAPNEQEAFLASKNQARLFADRRLFLAEKHAYSTLYRWVCEISELLPAYRDYLSAQRSRGYVLDRLVTDEEIVRIYGLGSLGNLEGVAGLTRASGGRSA